MESSGGERPGAATDAAEGTGGGGRGEESVSEKVTTGVRQELEVSRQENDAAGKNGGSFRNKGSRKEAPLSSLVAGTKRKRNSLNAVRVEPNGPVAGAGKREDNVSNLGDSTWNKDDDPPLSLSGKKDHRARSVGNSGNSVGGCNGAVIGRKPRGVLRQKRAQNSVSLKGVKDGNEASNVVESSVVAQSIQLSGHKLKRKSGELKENRVGGDNNRLKNENGSWDQGPTWKIFSEDDIHSDKGRSENVPEDEVSLEENAAMMLCSLSDQKCTVMPKRMKSPDRSLNASSLLQSNHFKSSKKEVMGINGEARVLRRRDGRSAVRKRRHFYEVSPRDVDPFCIVKQRIRVFWPLDKTWYFGLVKEYDPVTRLHHVRYDDRDEEWIDLQNERFKLLLFPSEVTNRSNHSNSRSVFKPKYDEDDREDVHENSAGAAIESEPIISWLARSVNRAKSSTSSNTNRRNHIHSSRISTLFERKQSAFVNSSNVELDKLFSSDTVQKSSAHGSKEVLPRSTSVSRDTRLPFVYFRKRFRKRKDGFFNISVKDSDPTRTAGSVTVHASVVDGASAVESNASVQLRQVTLRLSLPLQSVDKFICEGYSFRFCHTLYLLQHGTLVPVWPMVHLDIVFVDNALGLKYLFFETCLRSVVSLFCLLVGMLHRCSRQCSLDELPMPFTSIRFQISRLHAKSQVVFLLFSFFGMETPYWEYLEKKLQHCCLKKELSAANCTYPNIKELKNGSDQKVSTSMNLLLPEQDSSCNDLGPQLFPLESIYSDVNPVICYLDEHHESCSLIDLDVASVPSALLGWHLKLLIENNSSSDGFQQSMSFTSEEDQSNTDKLTADVCSSAEESSEQVSQNTAVMVQYSSGHVASGSGVLAFNHNAPADASNTTNCAGWTNHPINSASREVTVCHSAVTRRYNENNVNGAAITFGRFPCENGLYHCAEEPCSSHPQEFHAPQKSEDRHGSSIHAPQGQTSDRSDEQLFNRSEEVTQPLSNLLQRLNETPIGRAMPTAPRSTWHRSRFTSISRTFGDGLRLWPEDFMLTGIASGSKKPRTQVSYATSPRGDELGSKHRSNSRKVQTYTNVKANNSKRFAVNSTSFRSSLDSLTCDANVLVTFGNRGWRECGAQVLLDSDDQSEWRICVKLSGAIKYTHKVCHLLQTGTTNRYTHAMMWKGGMDWSLEFTDRSQWTLFKQIHEECHSRNIRAACVKNIPTPVVRLIADAYNVDDEVPFMRSPKYFGQVGTDIEMALDQSRVLYDMDSDDDEWFSSWKKSLECSNINGCDVTEDLFERIMDRFEKLAYTHQLNEFTNDQIEELLVDVGPMDIVKMIHDYWRDKRQKKGIPLIRHLQPSMWKIYQQQLQEWESAVNKVQSSSNGFQAKDLPPKPPMFAFCLRPRGLEVPYKGLKQRSHKKLMFSGYHSSLLREQDGYNRYGRRTNEFPVGEGSYESPDTVGLLHSPPGYSPRVTARTDFSHVFDASERCPPPKFYRTSSVKRTGTFSSSEDRQMASSFRPQKSKRTGADHWNAVAYEWPNSKQIFPETLRNHRVDIAELKLRDATSAAQHAMIMAKLKREKAHLLMQKADLALHKATVALMIADAIKTSERDPFRD